MSNDLLDQLRPIKLPDNSISVWPLAPGWWILLGIILLVCTGFIFLRPLLKSRRQKQQLRENTLGLLSTLFADCKKEADTALALQVYLQKSNDIFKRVIHNSPQLSGFSSLSGDDWADFLARIDPKSPYAKLYGNNLYALRCNEKISLDELHHWAITWLSSVAKRGTAARLGNKPAQEISP
jgi:hypothetical protein